MMKVSQVLIVFVFFNSDESSEACSIVDDHEGPAQHHHFDLGGFG
jgi:hypothetical protein